MGERSALNAYTLRVRSSEEEIALVQSEAGLSPQLYLGPDVAIDRQSVQLGTDAGESLPGIEGLMLRNAAPALRGDGQNCLVARNGWNGIIQRVTARQLDFGMKPFADIVFWAGAEGLEPLARYGQMNDPFTRDEVFAIGEGKRIIIADRKPSIKILTCVRNRPVMSDPKDGEVVEYIFGCATSPGAHQHKIDWSLRTLIALGETRRAAMLQQRFPTARASGSDRNNRGSRPKQLSDYQ